MRQQFSSVAAACVLAALFALLSAGADVAWADIAVDPPPRPSRPAAGGATRLEPAPLAIRIDDKAEQATIKIPARFLPRAGARPGAKAGAALPNVRTIVAGLAISLAVAGAFFLRRHGRVRAAAIAAVAAAALLGVWSAAQANIAVPDRDETIIREVTEEATLAKGRVKIEVVPSGEAVLLIVPPGMLPEKVEAPVQKTDDETSAASVDQK